MPLTAKMKREGAWRAKGYTWLPPRFVKVALKHGFDKKIARGPYWQFLKVDFPGKPQWRWLTPCTCKRIQMTSPIVK